ncbi:hypothetical protein BJ875DRAFT_477704 [Amylocarpus encephaloides]|uniref:Secreted protein n=1 Tax=Amylocarpus encephaloides TaxID=45428 RepID=A0A9P8BZE0_9HELO|nr:hypothetical protein BJ875DRAFT_477704 [Amylocarpus encephaloides]
MPRFILLKTLSLVSQLFSLFKGSYLTRRNGPILANLYTRGVILRGLTFFTSQLGRLVTLSQPLDPSLNSIH